MSAIKTDNSNACLSHIMMIASYSSNCYLSLTRAADVNGDGGVRHSSVTLQYLLNLSGVPLSSLLDWLDYFGTVIFCP